MLRFLVFLLLSIAFAWSAKPMEPLVNYNVIMVHGAADSKGGIKDGDVKKDVCNKDAYGSYGEIFGSADMMGKNGYKNKEKENLLHKGLWGNVRPISSLLLCGLLGRKGGSWAGRLDF
jgi:hypothetical protein